LPNQWIKDMMICGVENVYPREVDELLYRTPTSSASR
jgi:acyl-CoA synthetase (AMP-forming)/AMP-acid ligase II